MWSKCTIGQFRQSKINEIDMAKLSLHLACGKVHRPKYLDGAG
jgi:hypothetical protein